MPPRVFLCCLPSFPASVQPLANVICNYICCDRNNQWDYVASHILTSLLPERVTAELLYHTNLCIKSIFLELKNGKNVVFILLKSADTQHLLSLNIFCKATRLQCCTRLQHKNRCAFAQRSYFALYVLPSRYFCRSYLL